MNPPMLMIDGLSIVFGHGAARNRALQEVSFSVPEGGSFGLVGESGSGKSTVLNCIAGLLDRWTGTISVAGLVLHRRRDLWFSRQVQMVFQDPYASLHPRHTVDRTLREPLAIHRLGDASRRVEQVLREVGLGPQFRFRYPHQLSGGQRQRVAIARSLILDPALILLDEPTSALDVSIQAEVLNLLQDIRKQRRLTYLLVSHDLAVVSHMCHHLAVMSQGVIVETISREQLQSGEISHPYTGQLLLAGKGYDRAAIDAFEDFHTTSNQAKP